MEQGADKVTSQKSPALFENASITWDQGCVLQTTIKTDSGMIPRFASQNISHASGMLQGLLSKTPFDFSWEFVARQAALN